MKFKCITYNIWHGTFLDKVIKFLKSENPDIIFLQEMSTKGLGFDSINSRNVYQEIKSSLQMEGDFVRTFEVKTAKDNWDLGNATFTRFPILESSSTFYSGQFKTITGDWTQAAEQLPRAYLHTQIDLAGVKLNLINTHFVWSPRATDTPTQLKKARVLRSHLVNLNPLILAGDFNCLPTSRTYQIIAKGLKDASGKAGTSTLHPTIHKVGSLPYHVDHVLFKGIKLKHLTAHIPLVNASDHLPIVCTFEIS